MILAAEEPRSTMYAALRNATQISEFEYPHSLPTHFTTHAEHAMIFLTTDVFWGACFRVS